MRVVCVGSNPNQIKERPMGINKVYLAGTRSFHVASRIYLAMISFRTTVGGPPLFVERENRSIYPKSFRMGQGSHQGNREKARRLRQRAKGMLHF